MTILIHVLFNDDKTGKGGTFLYLIATNIFCLMDWTLEIKQVF